MTIKNLHINQDRANLLGLLVISGPMRGLDKSDSTYKLLAEAGMAVEISMYGEDGYLAATPYGRAALVDYYQCRTVAEVLTLSEQIRELETRGISLTELFVKADFKAIKNLVEEHGVDKVVDDLHAQRHKEQHCVAMGIERDLRDMIVEAFGKTGMITVSPPNYNQRRALEFQLGRTIQDGRIAATFTIEMTNNQIPVILRRDKLRKQLGVPGYIVDQIALATPATPNQLRRVTKLHDEMKKARGVDGARQVLADPNASEEALATARCTLAHQNRADAPGGLSG